MVTAICSLFAEIILFCMSITLLIVLFGSIVSAIKATDGEERVIMVSLIFFFGAIEGLLITLMILNTSWVSLSHLIFKG